VGTTRLQQISLMNNGLLDRIEETPGFRKLDTQASSCYTRPR
jgi:hypothetical protein